MSFKVNRLMSNFILISLICNQTQKSVQSLAEPFRVLKNKVFATLYFAESISLLGDTFTWVGLVLLSYQFGRDVLRSAFFPHRFSF